MDVVFDIETKESFQEVGGRGNVERLSVSVLGLYRYDAQEFSTLEEHELDRFGELLGVSGIRLVGFNIGGFDLPVLKKYVGSGITQVQTLDLMDEVEHAVGRRLPLESLLQGTLEEGKTGHGLQAIDLWKAGKLDELKRYCLDDVRLTRDLYDYGRERGEVYYVSNVDGSRYRIPVRWGREGSADLDPLLQHACTSRLCVMLSYAADGKEYERVMEPHSVDEVGVQGRMRETGEDVVVPKSAIRRARLVVQRF